MHRVYEINRNFRNEGISTQHNPEFTMLEFYWAYSNYEHLMDVTEELLVELAERILGTKKLTLSRARNSIFTPPVAQAEHGGGAGEVRRPVDRRDFDFRRPARGFSRAAGSRRRRPLSVPTEPTTACS